MPFDQSAVIEVEPPAWTGTDLLLSWRGALAAGRTWQVYLNGGLAWHGESNHCHLPWPDALDSYDVGTALYAEARTSFSGSLPARPSTRATLAWQGGTYQDATGARDVKGFRVYGEPSPGAGIDDSTPLADIPAYTARVVTDGFGLGGFGGGGFGMAPASYSWTSRPLSGGTWNFAVATYGASGIEGTPSVQSCTIVAPPRPPALYPGTLTRLTVADAAFAAGGFGTGGFGGAGPGFAGVVLSWNPSPS